MNTPPSPEAVASSIGLPADRDAVSTLTLIQVLQVEQQRRWATAKRALVEELRTVAGVGGRRSVAFSGDGRTLASDDLRTVIMWDLASGKQRFALKGHQESVFAVAFTSDGKTLASGGDDCTVKLWDGAAGTELRTLKGHTDAIGSLAFTPDGKTLASGSNDGAVKLWDIAAGKERATLRPKSDPKANRAHSVVFLPDGKTLVLGLMDGTVRLWDVTTATQQPRNK